MRVVARFCQDLLNQPLREPTGSLVLFKNDFDSLTYLDVASRFTIHVDRVR